MKYLLNLAAIVTAIYFLAGCNYLDKMPDDMKTMDMVWSSRVETEKYLYNIYSQILDESESWKTAPYIGASDECDYTWDRSEYISGRINRGDWNSSSAYYPIWYGCYQAIRCSFVFENNVGKCNELDEKTRTQYLAEVKFLRAYYYWLLLRQYGPFVLIEKETQFVDNWHQYARTPYDDCVNYISTLLDEAAENLPWSWHDQNQWYGKPTKVICKTIKAEVLLMAASPQWNGNKEYAGFKNLDGTPLVNTTYDENKWKLAANAAKEVITYGETMPELNLRLYKNNENGEAVFNPFISCRDALIKKWNCEIIWARSQNVFNIVEKHCTPRPGGWSGCGPTQRLVDAFYMENGRDIDDEKSGYSENGFAEENNKHFTSNKISDYRLGNSWGHRIGDFNMFANREARFYTSILYNGRPIPQANDNDRDIFSSDKNKDGWGRAELYNFGKSGATGSQDFSRTGYLFLKRVNPASNPYRDQHAEQRPFVYIRLAQVYLNYIESLNEYDPNHQDIKKYWDLIHERAGIPSIFNVYPGIKGNKAKQLDYILRERQVELCFETGDRYFTTRRRWIAHTTDTERPENRRRFGDGGPLYGLNVLGGDNSNGFGYEGYYNRTKFEDRVFDKKMYLFPIDQKEIDRSNNIVQNPGW